MDPSLSAEEVERIVEAARSGESAPRSIADQIKYASNSDKRAFKSLAKDIADELKK
jgi:hypothetical protein